MRMNHIPGTAALPLCKADLVSPTWEASLPPLTFAGGSGRCRGVG